MMRTLAVTTAVAVAYSALAAQEPPAAADPSPAAPAAAAEAADAAEATAPKASPFVEALVADLRWRHLGPANPMGRMTDIAVHPARQSTWFVGTAGGGLWQTDNAGTTWSCVSARLGSVSIGDVAIAPSNPDIVWIGTGEENARNSVQWGDGVYKSTDGGDGPADAPGAILRAISEGGPAAKAGLQAGDRVTKVGDEAVKT
ncbi:MAG: PDZ domain-containing protein, partial [Planctomycetota bacterium]